MSTRPRVKRRRHERAHLQRQAAKRDLRSPLCSSRLCRSTSPSAPALARSPKYRAMKDAWSYGTTVKPPDASTASLTLRATAPVPATADTVLASDQVDLRTRIYADVSELGARSLLGSVVVEELKSWLIKVLPSAASTSTAQTLIELTSSATASNGSRYRPCRPARRARWCANEFVALLPARHFSARTTR